MNLYRYTTEWLRGIKRDPAQLRRKTRSWHCPLCQFSGRFIDAGARRDARCPNCGSRERERIIGLYWMREPWDWAEARILHFSPEKAIWPMLRGLPGYVSSDVERHKRAAETLDIRALAKPDASFDYLICNHVLEHVVEDRKAMAECFRVLRPSGKALFSVPIEPDLAETWTPPPEMDAVEIARICGELHVRLYGADFPDLLRQTGFEVREIAISDAEDMAHRLRWPGVDQVFVATRP
ncbi:MAG: methyltransferase domain-containing protein [Pseudomonadota bacterium]